LIHYVCTPGHLYTLQGFLESWAPDLTSRFRTITYRDLMSSPPPARPGAYVFADLERLTPTGLQAAARFRRSLEPLGDRVHVLNDPTRALRRYDLLRKLYESWVNSFDAYRMTEPRRPRSWPVLLRREYDHRGAIGELIANPETLDSAVAKLAQSPEGLDGAIAVEFRDTADNLGVYRKYGAFRIGDRILPRHVLFSRHWCVKEPDLLEAEHIEEELQYVQGFPHAEAVKPIFDLARIDYGRIDYSFYEGRLQVWEINTNPILVKPASAEAGAPRREANTRFAALAREAFLALHTPFEPSGGA
jgi:hypothetical protein